MRLLKLVRIFSKVAKEKINLRKLISILCHMYTEKRNVTVEAIKFHNESMFYFIEENKLEKRYVKHIKIIN